MTIQTSYLILRTENAHKAHPARPQRARTGGGTYQASLDPLASITCERLCSLPPGVFDFGTLRVGDARTKLGAMRVLSRWGWAGEKRGFLTFSQTKAGSGAYTTGCPIRRSNHPAINSSFNGALFNRASIAKPAREPTIPIMADASSPSGSNSCVWNSHKVAYSRPSGSMADLISGKSSRGQWTEQR